MSASAAASSTDTIIAVATASNIDRDDLLDGLSWVSLASHMQDLDDIEYPTGEAAGASFSHCDLIHLLISQ